MLKLFDNMASGDNQASIRNAFSNLTSGGNQAKIKDAFDSVFSGAKEKGLSDLFGSNPLSKGNSPADATAKDSNQSWDNYWDDMGYNQEAGETLANAGKDKGAKMNSKNKCGTGVSKSFNSVYGTSLHGNGCDWDENMRGRNDFEELNTDDFSKDQLKQTIKNLPAGAVICWDQQDRNGNGKLDDAGEKYGHVAIADGNGGEMSDHYSSHTYSGRIDDSNFTNDKCSIFIPV